MAESKVYYQDYKAYLRYQRWRGKRSQFVTSSKQRARARDWFWDHYRNLGLQANDALCLGARHKSEVEFFKKKGLNPVDAIDLFADEQIIKCDMSQIDRHGYFKDKKYDLVVSIKSIEHCIDLAGLVRGLKQVCRGHFLCVTTLADEPTKWDAAIHPFMTKDPDACRSALLESFPGFGITHTAWDEESLFFALFNKNQYIL